MELYTKPMRAMLVRIVEALREAAGSPLFRFRKRGHKSGAAAGFSSRLGGQQVRISSMVLLVAYTFYYRNEFSITIYHHMPHARDGVSYTPEHSISNDI